MQESMTFFFIKHPLEFSLLSYLQIELFCKFFNVRETNFSLERNNYIYFDLAGLDSDPELQSLVAMCLADLMNDFTEVFAEEPKFLCLMRLGIF